MVADGATLWVLAVVFLATLVRSALGFGEALVAVPLIALFAPVQLAAPLAALLSVTVAAMILFQDRHKIDVASAWRLVVSTLLGIPLGLLLLTSAPQRIVKAALAVVLIAFALYCLVTRRPFELKGDRLAWLFGFAAGVLGGAYGMNGPPLAVYGSLRGWSAEQFRATLQGYFLPASMAGLCGYWAAGLWVPAITRYYLLSLPLILVAVILGGAVNRRLDGRPFQTCVQVGLVAIGTVLLVQASW